MRWLKRDDEDGTVTGGSGPEPTAGPSESDGLIDSADVPQLAEVRVASPAPDTSAAQAGAAEPVIAVSTAAASPAAAPADALPAGALDVAPPAATEPERRQLIELLIYAWDRARSPGVWERLTEGLSSVGVTALRPDGEPFDPDAHEVGGVMPTEDDTLVDTVAETEVAGFADRGTVIREPVVVVYRRQSG